MAGAGTEIVGEDKRGACMTAQRAGRLVRGSEDTKEERYHRFQTTTAPRNDELQNDGGQEVGMSRLRINS